MKKLVVLTGAGMSAESGIRTFRDSDGLWEEYNVMDVCTPEAWQRDPELVNRFYNERRKQLYEAQPNAGHFGLAELEKDFDVQIITQRLTRTCRKYEGFTPTWRTQKSQKQPEPELDIRP